MVKSVYGFKYNFIQSKESLLVLYKEPGIKPEELDFRQINILNVVTHSKLLPFELEQLGSNTYLRYNVTSKQSLSTVLGLTKVSMLEYYRLFHSITAALEDAERHGLNIANCMLTEDLIFVGQGIQDLYLINIPQQSFLKGMSLGQEMTLLLEGFLRYVADPSGTGYHHILRCCESKNFSIASFKQTVQFAMESAVEDESSSQSAIVPISATVHLRAVPKPKLPLQSIQQQLIDSPSPAPNRKKMDTTIVWNIMQSFLQLFKWKKKPVQAPHLDEKPQRTFPKDVWKDSPSAAVKANIADSNLETTQQQAGSQAPEALGSSAADPTVYLGSALEQQSIPRLEKGRNGQLEVIPLQRDSLIIGRNASADYVEDVFGVSRMHALILREGERFYVKDLGSSNGTLLNQKKLEPNQTHMLKNGDVIRIVRSEFVFKLS